ncbi:hypothetical protein TIFTF001_034925 [Ficus carica]|uniref:Uncharacterized protein n=1 Tax=Ficus carica TaxID=3494 RepID=A0AA88J993_FICCA|nr:hypothetical protein TIFTF001_034925 [Ficus carica]
MKCPGCERPAEVCVTEFLGVKTEDGILLMQLQTNGLQPIDDHIRFYTDMFAIDLDGNVSREFDLEVRADDPDNGAAELNIEFKKTVAYCRAVNSIQVTFERV